MPRTDFTIFTVAPALSEAKILGSIHASVAGTHRLQFATSAAGGVNRYQRTGVTKTNHGTGIFYRTNSGADSSALSLFLRITTLADPATFYRAVVSNASTQVFRVVAGISTLLYSDALGSAGNVLEVRFMAVTAGGTTTLQIERRNVTASEAAFTVQGVIVDPSPIAGPGGVGFGVHTPTGAGSSSDVDNWREFDAS